MKSNASPAFFDDEDSDSSMEITLLYSESDDDSEAYADARSTFSISSDDEGNHHVDEPLGSVRSEFADFHC